MTHVVLRARMTLQFARLLQSYPFMTCPKVVRACCGCTSCSHSLPDTSRALLVVVCHVQGFGFDLGQCDMDALPLADMYKLYPLTSWVRGQTHCAAPPRPRVRVLTPWLMCLLRCRLSSPRACLSGRTWPSRPCKSTRW